MVTYPRFWAGIGNMLRVSALLGFLVAALLFANAFDRFQAGALGERFFIMAAAAVATLLYSFLLWLAKPVLVSGRPFIVRWLIGAYMALWVISTIGFGLFFIGLAYATAGTPVDWEPPTRASPKGRRAPAPPRNWVPTGQIGLSGANVYADVAQSDWFAEVDSGTPVQVVDKQAGFAYVIAASGMRGWIDLRTLVEAA